jgi:hypothetical protein
MRILSLKILKYVSKTRILDHYNYYDYYDYYDYYNYYDYYDYYNYYNYYDYYQLRRCWKISVLDIGSSGVALVTLLDLVTVRLVIQPFCWDTRRKRFEIFSRLHVSRHSRLKSK